MRLHFAKQWDRLSPCRMLHVADVALGDGDYDFDEECLKHGPPSGCRVSWIDQNATGIAKDKDGEHLLPWRYC